MDVAVVGGGISGLYAAKKLLEADHRVVLFEATDRLGGRILSRLLPDMQVPAELGAMRFRTQHARLSELLNDLGLNTTDKIGDFKFETRFYLRGQFFSDDPNSYQDRFTLYTQETGKKPGELMQYALERLFAQSPIMAAAFTNFLKSGKSSNDLADLIKRYQASFKYDQHIDEDPRSTADTTTNVETRLHTPLHNVGFWNIIALLLSSEAYHLAHDAIGYDSLLSAWNAAEAIPYFISDYIDDRYKTIRGGMSTLVTDLEKKLNEYSAKSQFQIKRRHVLETISFDAREFGSDTRSISLRFQNSAVYRCNHAVLALPRSPLERLKVSGSSEWNAFRRVSMSVREEPAFKCFLVYKEAWWSKDPSWDPKNSWKDDECYRICTDLPLRQIYLFPGKWLQSTHGRDNVEHSLVMASYSDAHYTNFWRPMLSSKDNFHEDSHDTFNRRQQFTDNDFQSIKPHLASKRMVQYIVAQLFKIFECYNQHGEVNNSKIAEEIRNPQYALYKDWSLERGEAGWHFWQVHHRREFVEHIIDRLAQHDGICICGEAYSDQQGWVEGALAATCRVLGKAGLVDDKQCR